MIGRTLAHYTIIEKIGEGGMGEVWRASDKHLDRDVAIKVLPEVYASDPGRLARFEREAKLLASLNHPGIAGIYGLHQADGVRFLAMELVPGEDLSQRLLRGPVPVDEVMVIARQIAEALETAHDQGVIHRDLKPGNVKLTPEDQVKVLDFGLAKALEASDAPTASALTRSPTITGLTGDGVILGTAAYMSPEQARGKTVDRRADIWAFGCVLYEMITGARPFEGETITDTLAAIVRAEPDYSRLPTDTPDVLRFLLHRCLEKESQKRLQAIGEARLLLTDPSAHSLAGSAVGPVAAVEAPRVSAGRGWARLAVGLVAGVLLASTAWFLMREDPGPRFGRQLVLGTVSPGLARTAISPDGSHAAWLGGGRLWLRGINELTPRQVPGSGSASFPAWSPDGRWVAYAVDRRLFKLDVAGGQPLLVAELPEGMVEQVGGIAWGEDGTILFTTGDSGLWSVSAQGGDPAEIMSPESLNALDFHDGSFLPGGSGVLFIVHPREGNQYLAVWSGGESEPRRLLDAGQLSLQFPVYSSTGHIIYQRRGVNAGVWAVPFSVERLEMTGDPFTIVSGGRGPSVASDGSLVYVTGSGDERREIVWVDRAGNVVDTIGSPQLALHSPNASPDGRRIAVRSNEGGSQNIWIQDVNRKGKSRQSDASNSERYARWSPDGRWLTFTRLGSEASTYVKRVDGADAPRLLMLGGHASWSADGKYILYEKFGGRGIWYRPVLDLAGPLPALGDSVLIFDEEGDESDPLLSPDGRYLLFDMDVSGRSEVFVTRFPTGQGRWQVSVEGGSNPEWSPRGDEIFFIDEQQQLVAVPVDLGGEPELGEPEALFGLIPFGVSNYQAYSVGPRAERFLMTRPAEAGEMPRVVLYENWNPGH